MKGVFTFCLVIAWALFDAWCLMPDGMTGNLQTRPGLLYLFIVGWQWQTPTHSPHRRNLRLLYSCGTEPLTVSYKVVLFKLISYFSVTRVYSYSLYSRWGMTSSNGNIFRFSGPLLGESTGHWCILLTKNDLERWFFLWSALEQTVGQTIEAPAIWDTVARIMTSV